MVALRAGLGALAILPEGIGLPVGSAGGALWGRILSWTRGRTHAVAARNLSLAFPNKTDSERRALLREMWRGWGRFTYETARLTRLTPERVRAKVRFESPERFREVAERAKKRGMLVLTAHFGSFEMLHAAVSAYGAPVSLVHRPMANPLVDDFLAKFRARFGTKVMERGHAAREIIRELRAGRIVAIPFDQMAKKENRIFLPFFGVNASTNTGLARLAMGSGAPVHGAFLVREGSSRFHHVVIGPEIPVARTGDREADVIENSRRFNAVLEAAIRDHPDHWIWNYRRWRQQPDGIPSPYLPWAPPLEEYRAAAARGTGSA